MICDQNYASMAVPPVPILVPRQWLYGRVSRQSCLSDNDEGDNEIKFESGIPLILISYIINFNTFFIFIIISSVLICTIGGYNQTSIRKILTLFTLRLKTPQHLGCATSHPLNEFLYLPVTSVGSHCTIGRENEGK
jgi:hypothetical protein